MKYALLRTLPGRAIVIGTAIKIAVFALGLVARVPAFVRVVDTVASVAVVAGAAYFLWRGLAFAQRRLLWRVRRKLIISYIFIGFIPAILIVAFFLLGGLLLFSNFSSYLLQTRLHTLTDRAAAVAATTAIEIQRAGGRDAGAILARREAAIATEFPGASLALVPMDRGCGETRDGRPAPRTAPEGVAAVETAGPWDHVDPPTRVPEWLGCAGFSGLLAYGDGTAQQLAGGQPAILPGEEGANRRVQLLARAVAVPDSRNARDAVVVDLLVNGAVKQQLRRETGVELTSVRTVVGDVPLLPGRAGGATEPIETAASTLPVSSVSFPEVVDWTTGQPRSGAVMAAMQLSIGEIYDRISAAQGSIANRSFGQGLLLVLIVIGVLFLIIEAIALVAGLALARSITGSIHGLFTGTERVRQGDFTHKIGITAQDQLGELAASFNSMTASIEDLLRDAAEKKRLEEELRIAHEIQMSLLPQGALTVPGVSVTAVCVPAREVGGDYYDFLPLDDHRVGVLIADVSGKGTYAALYMAELKGLMLSLTRIYTSPRELLITANRIISEHLDARSFITMTYAVLDLHARTMTYARAGHTPLIYRPGAGPDRRLRVLAPDGLVLGLKIDGGETFDRLLQEDTIPLHPGDLYLFFTDGITEAMNSEDDCFGETRLGTLIEEHAHLPSDQLRERVLREIAAFVGDTPQHDDMTMILLRIEDIWSAPVASTAEPELAAQPV